MVSHAAPTASSLSSTLGTTSTSVHSSSATQGALASSGGDGISNSNPVISTVSMSLNINGVNQGASSSDINNTRNNEKGKKKLKGGLTLVYAADGEGADEFSMEETRALLPRYQKLLSRASTIRNASVL